MYGTVQVASPLRFNRRHPSAKQSAFKESETAFDREGHARINGNRYARGERSRFGDLTE